MYEGNEKGPFCYFSIFNVLLFVVVVEHETWENYFYLFDTRIMLFAVKENFLIFTKPNSPSFQYNAPENI